MSKEVTVYSAMPLLNRPGPRRMLKERGWQVKFIVDVENRIHVPPHEVSGPLMDYADQIEFLVADITPLPRAFFEKAKNLRWAGMFGAGLNHIDIAAATDHNVLITNAAGANSRSTAGLAICFMFLLSRRIIPQHNQLMQGVWKSQMGNEISEKTLGIIGLGSIGTHVAVAAKALGLNVIAYTRTPKPELAAQLGVKLVGLDELLQSSDYVSVNMSALPDGSAFIGKEEIAKMRKGACLINVARGSLVDYNALTEALMSGHLAGAGLDVYPHEPLTLEDQKAMAHPLFSLPNVVCTPHVGGMTEEATERVAAMCLAEVERMIKGERSPNAANPLVYEKLGM
ncbi:hypothetical protein LJB93_03360 [Desulfovibrio sp. OttesenSCG-928-F07]|nr:hypothetical protein [Desulfovibrio sp. OttesenSCG-928-F07]